MSEQLEHPCYAGQWVIHPRHTYETVNGSTKRQVVCPGQTKETVMGYRPGTTLEFETVGKFLDWHHKAIGLA